MAVQPDPETDVEIVDALPVPSDAPAPVRAADGALPVPVVRQAAAVAATSFVAGAATIVVARIVRRRGLRRRRRSRRALGQVIATRSFLVDVHVLGSRD
jgi:hypothetical protein